MGIDQAVVQLGPVENTLGTIGLLFAGPNVGNPAVHAVLVDIREASTIALSCYHNVICVRSDVRCRARSSGIYSRGSDLVDRGVSTRLAPTAI